MLEHVRSISSRIFGREKTPADGGHAEAWGRMKREAGLGTLEIVVITGILLTVALIFNVQIRDFATRLFDRVFNESRVISNILK